MTDLYELSNLCSVLFLYRKHNPEIPFINNGTKVHVFIYTLLKYKHLNYWAHSLTRTIINRLTLALELTHA